MTASADAFPPSFPPQGLIGLHVLVVDDNQDVLRFMKLLLEIEQARVSTAENRCV